MGVTGWAGNVVLDDASGLKVESPLAMHSAASDSEGACWWEQYRLLVWITKAKDKKV